MNFKEKLERAFEKAWPNMAPTGESAMKWAASFALEEAAEIAHNQKMAETQLAQTHTKEKYTKIHNHGRHISGSIEGAIREMKESLNDPT